MKIAGRLGLIFVLVFAIIPLYAANAAEEDGGSTGTYDQEIVYNGGFELSPTPPRKIEGWESWPEEDPIGVVASPTDPGNQVLKIASEGIPVKWGISEAHQWVDVQPNHPFELTADVYFAEAVEALFTIRIDFYDDTLFGHDPSSAYITHYYKDIYLPNEGFERIEIKGIAPEGVKIAKVEIQLKAFEAGASGTIYVDDVSLRHLWAPTKLRVAEQTDTSILLEWDKPSDGLAYSYEIYEAKLGKIGAVDNAGKPEETTSFLWDDLPSASEAKRIWAYSLSVVGKPISDPERSTLPSNTLRVAALKPDGTFTVMPFGDSLTVGVYSGQFLSGGYRGYLWDLMRPDFPNMMFVGSEELNPYPSEDFTPDHEGHSGYAVYRMNDELIDDQAAVYAPDYILLHAGTNNMFEDRNRDEEAMKEEVLMHMTLMLEKIRKKLPETYVIVASIPGIYVDDDEDGIPELLPVVASYNHNLKLIVERLRNEGHKIGFVDMGAMVSEQYFADPDNDHIHPNAAGYGVMADVWHDALDAAVRTGDIEARMPGKPTWNPPVLHSEDTSVYLSWGAVSDNVGVDRYEIFRNGEPSAISVTTATYGLLTGLAPATAYSFTVEAVDKAGNRTRSDSLAVTTTDLPDRSPPTVPMDLAADGVGHDRFTLSWLGSTDDVGIKEYVASFGGQSISITDAVYGNENRYSYEIGGLAPETSYAVTLQAVDHAGNSSGGSLPIAVETKAAPPGNLKIADKTRESLTLAWDPAVDKDGIQEYRIYRDGVLLGATSETAYTANSLVSGGTYTFRVTAVDRLGHETLPSELKHTMELYPPSWVVAKSTEIDSLSIQWASVNGAAAYNVYVNGIFAKKVAGTEYKAEKLTPDTLYSFAVESVFGDGSASVKSEPLELKTKKVPDPVGRPPVSFGGGGGYIPAKDVAEYRETPDGAKLRFVPSADEDKNVLNGSDKQLTIDVPTDKPFSLLELELSGEVVKLAADKKKPIVVRIGGLTMELPAGWLKTENRDKVVLSVTVRPLTGDDAVKEQSLKPLSSGYGFELRVNGKVVTAFAEPISLKIAPGSPNGTDRYGIYLMDRVRGLWTFNGELSQGGAHPELKLTHFSEYAVLANRVSFTDIASHWAREDIEYLASLNIVKGLSDGRFHPSGQVSRAEFAAMLARAFGLSAGQGDLPFEDVAANAWYYSEVGAAYRAGWVQGVGDTRFAPTDRITREQMAVMIVKAYLQAQDKSLTPSGSGTEGLGYQDAAAISGWASAYVRLATEEKLVQGIGQSFQPGAFADRAQAAVMISRLLRTVK